MSNEMVFLTDGMVATSSRVVAEYFGKQHKHVLDSIDGKMGSAENSATLESMFFETTYIHEQNKQEYREVIMNRDGFSLLAMGFTGSKALEFQLKFIQEFNRMEAELKAKHVPTTYKDALLALVAEVEAKERAELLLEEKTTQLDESKEWYSIKRVAVITKKSWQKFSWRRLKNESDYLGYDVKKIFDANYGEVNVYHKDIWCVAYPEVTDYLK